MLTRTKLQSSPILLPFAAIFLLIQAPTKGAVIFSESFGTVGGTTTIAANNFDNDGFTFSGTGDIRSTTVSTTSAYSGASGAANSFLTNNGTLPYIMISDISTFGYTAGTIGISFGAWKSATASDMTTLLVQFSTDAVNWTAITIPEQPVGPGTAVWRALSFQNTAIPISSTLALRWTNTDTNTQYRIDDVVLTAIPEPTAAVIGALGLLGLLRRRR